MCRKKEVRKFRFEGTVGVDRCLREDPQRLQLSCYHRDIHRCHHFRIQNSASLGAEPLVNGHVLTVQKWHTEESSICCHSTKLSMQESYVENRNRCLKGAGGQQLPFFPQHLKWKKCTCNSQAIIFDRQLRYFVG